MRLREYEKNDRTVLYLRDCPNAKAKIDDAFLDDDDDDDSKNTVIIHGGAAGVGERRGRRNRLEDREEICDKLHASELKRGRVVETNAFGSLGISG